MPKRIEWGVLFGGMHHTDDIRRVVKQCDDWGYDYFWHPDERFYRDPYAGLAICAEHTERIKLGTAVTDPYSRHPALTAMGIATIDEASGGRAVLGIGAGISGLHEMGIERRSPARAIREAIHFIRQFLTNQSVDFAGEFVHFNSGVLSVPGRRDLPIFVASMSPLTIKLAGEIGDGLITTSCVADTTIDYVKGLLTQGADRAGRDPATVSLAIRVNVSISADGDRARQAVKPRLASLLVSRKANLWFLDQAGLEMPPEMAQLVMEARYAYDDSSRERTARIADLMPDAFVEKLALAGTGEQIAASIVQMAKRGVSQLIVYPMPCPGDRHEDVLRRLATEVMPVVEASEAS